MSIKISHGADEISSNTLDGKTADEVYDATKSMLGLPAKSELKVSVVDDDGDELGSSWSTEVPDGAEVEFSKESGSKG